MRYIVVLIIALLLVPAVALGQSPPVIHWQQYDYLVEVQPDGSVLFQERQEIVVEHGELNYITREFETGDYGRVTDVRVVEGGQAYRPGAGDDAPGTFTAEDDGTTAYIWVNFRDPSAAQHTLVIEYTVAETLLAVDEQAVLQWNFFWAGDGVPEIQNGSVEVRFPAPVDPSELELSAEGVPVQRASSEDVVRWELTQPIQGEQLYVETAFPRAVLAPDADLVEASGPVNPGVPAADPVQAPGAAGAAVLGSVVLCLVVLFILVIVFLVIRASARRRVYYPQTPPVHGPGPFGLPPVSGRRRRSWWGGGFFPPVMPGPPRREQRGPFDELFDDDDDDSSRGDRGGGGGGSWWGGGGGGGRSWSGRSGGGRSWGSRSGGGSFFGGSGGGGRSWGGGSRGGGRGGGGRGGGGFG